MKCTVLPLLAMALLLGCQANQINKLEEPWAQSVQLDSVSPSIITAGTTLTITGRDFVGRELGASRLILTLSDSALDNGPSITVSKNFDRSS